MSAGDPLQSVSERLAADAARAVLDLNYSKGMADGTLLFAELLLGDNKRGALPPEVFEAMRFQAPLTPESICHWVEGAYDRAIAHRARVTAQLDELEEGRARVL
jgi:hypothetical protein